MNNETFFGKIIVNALEAWGGGFGDEAVVRSILDNNRFLHGAWTDKLNQRKEKFLEEETEKLGYKMSYVSFSKLMTREDIAEMIKEIRVLRPLLTEDYELSKATLTLKDLLELTDAEALMLETSQRLHEGIDYDLYKTIQRLAEMDRLKHPEALVSQIYGISKGDAEKALDGFLIRSGLISETRGPAGFWNINSDIAPAFSIAEMTPDKMENLLFPASIETKLSIDDYRYIEKDISRSRNAIEKALSEKTVGMNIMLWGEPGTGKSELALVMAKEYGWNLKIVGDISPVESTEKSRSARLASLKLATKLLARDDRAVILFDEIEDLFKTDNTASFSKAFINRIIETSPVPIIWTTNSLYTVGNAVLRRMVYNINLGVPSAEHRGAMWRKYSKQYKLELNDSTITALGETYDIPPALIHNAVKVARAALSDEDRSNSTAITEIVASLDRLVNYGRKRVFEVRVSDEASTYDPSCSNTDRDLNDFTARLIKAKPNFSLLLFGPSGTGKSEFGKYLAHKMGLKLSYKKASDLLDKYVGGTEEKIAEAFEEAKAAGKVLLIDEGDSFLRNRERAERSWEVTQVNQMLTEMEAHSHPFIMTTNLKDDIDAAAMRRFTFKLHFDYMTPDMSEKLFKRFFKVDAPHELRKLDRLTPGDFANVNKQADTLEITDARELYEMLLEEVKQKPAGHNPIGF
jgi:transitional endoplasmic reticulum ATPase